MNSNKASWTPLRRFFYFLGLILFSMMIITPSAYQFEKSIILFFVFMALAIERTTTRQPKIHPRIFNIFIFYIILGLLYGIYGYARGNPGALLITKEVVLYVIFYLILICGIDDYDSLNFIHRILIFSTFFLCFYLIISILNAYGIWPDWLYYNLETETSDRDINIESMVAYGRLSTSFSSFPNLLFLQPYLFSYLMTDRRKTSKSLWILFIIMTGVMIFVGRRILLVVAILAPIIITMYLFFLNKSYTVRWGYAIFYLIITIISIGLVIKISGMEAQSIIDYLVLTFQADQITASGVVKSNVRYEIIAELYKGWKNNPLFGFGSGAIYTPFQRSHTEPWSYEVLYMQFLYNWGIIGCALYGLGIYYILIQLKAIYKAQCIYSNYAFSASAGMISFLIGTATNPYLLKFDVLYIIFFPVAILNIYFMRTTPQRIVLSPSDIGTGAPVVSP